ncbi:hypothetical protein AXF42_Ash014450 [Apostasia shenzhenica]|uniref:Uncharacterized protein n=1 Tax=Apostasia shenzhenica TaxID=1088818 RepID=A0A2H9ZWN0_9ASPA|nr:hypothetical protein AXF42_Ash014450 [Apostasia shenzhenica]
MGNCLSPSLISDDQKLLRIVKMDGKVLEFSSPLLVRELLMSFEGSGVGVISMDSSQLLPLDHELMVGSVYHLLPQDTKPPLMADRGESKRVKVVLTKQQVLDLVKMKMTVEELLGDQACRSKGEEPMRSCGRWKPELKTIAEAV